MKQRVPKPKPKRRLPRAPMPPPEEVLRDRRQRRPGEAARHQILAELDELESDIDAALEEIE